jgi:NAD(P)-dependent dehydrogenase (short-subunit alcohol dehydrogenase family)
MPVNNSAVLITGSAGGIGQALVKAFAAEGYYVIGLDRDVSPGVDHSVNLDLARLVADESVAKSLGEWLESALDGRPLRALVNNAAVQRLSPVESLTIADFRATLDVNLVAAFALVKLCLPWLEATGGSVINVGSIHARLTKSNFTAYATSKGALETLTRALAVELGARVRVNAVSPAAVETSMLLAGFEGANDTYDNLFAHHPTGRIARPEEVAELALYLAGDRATFVNGAVVDIDGGIGGRLHDPD